jgi:DNA polymerase-3 subunit alpha
LASVPDLPRRDLLAWEKEYLGTYLSDHPLSDIVTRAKRAGRLQVVELAERAAGETVRLVGMVAGARRIITKNNRTMAVIDFEDLTGNIELVAFPDCYESFASNFEADQILDVVAKVDRRNEQLQLICESVTPDLTALGGQEPQPRATLHVRLHVSDDVWADITVMQELDRVLGEFAGDDDVIVHVPTMARTVALRSRKHRVECGESLERALAGLSGIAQIEVEQPKIIAFR